jgi:hypothetical protein
MVESKETERRPVLLAIAVRSIHFARELRAALCQEITSAGNTVPAVLRHLEGFQALRISRTFNPDRYVIALEHQWLRGFDGSHMTGESRRKPFPDSDQPVVIEQFQIHGTPKTADVIVFNNEVIFAKEHNS